MKDRTLIKEYNHNNKLKPNNDHYTGLSLWIQDLIKFKYAIESKKLLI